MELLTREYRRSACAVFWRTRDALGGLSNMSTDFPLVVNGARIGTSEALYQACKFPNHPEIQRKILSQDNPMQAKALSRTYEALVRADWQDHNTAIMLWCVRVKLAQHSERFGDLLRATGNRTIVEQSRRDAFWGAIPQGELFDENAEVLRGVNALGELLTGLRDDLRAHPDGLRVVRPPGTPNFHLVERPIEPITR